MKYPYLQDTGRQRDLVTTFGGYNNTATCGDGEFLDMKNMTAEYYPVLAPRKERTHLRTYTNPMAVLDKDSLCVIDDYKLYIDGVDAGITLSNETPKTMTKMGGYIVIMPDRVWFNTKDNTSGSMDAKFETTAASFELCDQNGKIITWHDSKYYEKNDPKDGDYQISTSGGKSSLKIYSGLNRIWTTVATPYMQIKATGIGSGFKKGDGLKLSIAASVKESWSDVSNIFINDEGDYLTTNTVIQCVEDNYISIVGISAETHTLESVAFIAERSTPDMAYITECNNRLWGCSKDGHEIYCCKLGDVTNWNCYAGNAMDSYAATVGSDGVFTGAVTYQGYPIFFKEDSMLKVIPSATGAHQYKETACRGVQKGSSGSLCVLNEILYYKSPGGVCVYTGSVPADISETLGEVRYTAAVGGTINDRYYISMLDENEKPRMFVYNAKHNLWTAEDGAIALYFARYKGDLLFIDATDKTLKSVEGRPYFDHTRREGNVDWYAVSGHIGYSTPDQKYVSRISVRLTMEAGASCELYMCYDSSNVWEHVLSMSGYGTRSYTIPVIPHRCDHFQYKIRGCGNVRVHSISKTIEKGSDV